MERFVVVGNRLWIVLQVMLAVRARPSARCSLLAGPDCRPLKRSGMCDGWAESDLSGRDDESLIARVNEEAARHPGLVAIAADCDGARALARCRSRLRCRIAPIPEPETLELFDDKWRFYQFALEHGIPVPETQLVAHKYAIDFDAAVARFGLPFVVKPLNLQASDGVYVIASREQFDAAILHNADYRFAPLAVQRFAPGVDMGLNVLALDGRLLAYGIQRRAGPEVHFVANPDLEQAAHRICRSSRYTGVMNFDVRFNPETGESFFLEANPRVWASHIASIWCGLDFIGASLAPPGQLQALTSGFYAGDRHPIARPALWPTLLLDRGPRGRILRAMIFDAYLLPRFLLSLPQRLRNLAARPQPTGQAATLT